MGEGESGVGLQLGGGTGGIGLKYICKYAIICIKRLTTIFFYSVGGTIHPFAHPPGSVLARNSAKTMYWTYSCHRSGVYKPRGLGKRHVKVQGSAKIGMLCPAALRVRIFTTGKCILMV